MHSVCLKENADKSKKKLHEAITQVSQQEQTKLIQNNQLQTYLSHNQYNKPINLHSQKTIIQILKQLS